MTNTATTTPATARPDAPHWMDCERRFRFWEQNGISDRDRTKQIALTKAAYADVPRWQRKDAENRFVEWCKWFSDFCHRVNHLHPLPPEPEE